MCRLQERMALGRSVVREGGAGAEGGVSGGGGGGGEAGIDGLAAYKAQKAGAARFTCTYIPVHIQYIYTYAPINTPI